MSTYAEKLEELQRLRAEVRRLERLAEAEAKRLQPLTEADERSMTAMQARADEAYRDAGRRAPPPHAYERPGEYRRRLVSGLQHYSPRWRDGGDIELMDDAAIEVVESQVFADAANGRTHGIKPFEIRERSLEDQSGHKVREFDGGESAWFGRHFSRPARRAIFRERGEYARMSQNANLSRINEIVHTMRPPFKGEMRAVL